MCKCVNYTCASFLALRSALIFLDDGTNSALKPPDGSWSPSNTLVKYDIYDVANLKVLICARKEIHFIKKTSVHSVYNYLLLITLYQMERLECNLSNMRKPNLCFVCVVVLFYWLLFVFLQPGRMELELNSSTMYRSILHHKCVLPM